MANFSVWQQIRHAMLLRFDEHGSVGLSFARSPIIDTENFDGIAGIREDRRQRKPTQFSTVVTGVNVRSLKGWTPV